MDVRINVYLSDRRGNYSSFRWWSTFRSVRHLDAVCLARHLSSPPRSGSPLKLSKTIRATETIKRKTNSEAFVYPFRMQKHALGLLISIIAVSFASIFILSCQAPPLSIAFYRLFFTTLLLVPLIFVRKKT